jgi:hypothetical protein
MVVDSIIVPMIMPVVTTEPPSGTRITGIDIPTRPVGESIAGIDSHIVANVEIVVRVISNIDIGIAAKIGTVAADNRAISGIVSRPVVVTTETGSVITTATDSRPIVATAADPGSIIATAADPGSIIATAWPVVATADAGPIIVATTDTTRQCCRAIEVAKRRFVSKSGSTVVSSWSVVSTATHPGSIVAVSRQ